MQKSGKRPVGRPRATPSSGIPAREAILLEAARLFRLRGFDGTSTREIAKAVGIRQPSLYYHFPKKEDILRELVEAASEPWHAFLPQLRAVAGRSAAKLYRLMQFDFTYLMSDQYGIGQLIQLPELRRDELGDTVTTLRERIVSTYRQLITDGMSDGTFRVTDIEVATQSVFGMGEAIWSWYRVDDPRVPETTADVIADLGLRALLSEPNQLNAIKAEAAAIQLSPEASR